MFKLNYLARAFLGLLFVLAIAACNTTSTQPIKPDTLAYANEIKKDIAIGKRVENADNDSLLIAANNLYRLNKLTGDHSAMVYAGLYEGLFYWQSANHQKAMQIAVKTLDDANKLNIKKPLPQIYALIGNLNKEITNYNMAFKAADNGVSAAKANNDTASLIALLGLKAMFTRGLTLNQHHSQLNDSSIDLNLEALKIAESSPKYERLRIRFYDNIGQYYKDHKQFDKTYYYCNKAVVLAIKLNQKRSLTYAYCWLGEANYYQGQQATGIAYLNKALQIAVELKEPYRIKEINECFYDCYSSSGNYKEALHYYTQALIMRDSLKVLDNVKQIGELQLKYEASQKDQKIASLNSASQIQTLQRDTIGIILFLLLIIGVLIYIKEKKDKKLLQFGKQRVDEELRIATLELNYFTESLYRKNEIIEEFKSEIEQLHLQHINSADIEGLDNLVKMHIMTDESWDSFKKLFTKVHSRFFVVLKQKFPQLTATDTRILALIKLQLSNYEMANMLGVTVEGVKKSKQRLRKKMDLDKDENVEELVAAI